MNSRQDATTLPEDRGDSEIQAHNPPSAQTPRLAYMPGIDGLRAIAVIAVLLYHAELPFVAGGYLGVEVFFVISGFLITSLLVREWQKNGSINLGRFWFRRARRLLPAVYLLIVAVLAFAVISLRQEVASLRWDALAAAVYANNWYQIFSQQSYFEAVGRPSLLRHLWSLAVEEQFYIVWPVVLYVCLRWLTNRRLKWLTLICLAGAVASSMLMASLYAPDADPSRIYYGTDTRAAGFLVGAALAAWVSARTNQQRIAPRLGIVIDLLGVVSLIGLLGCFVFLNEIHPYLYLGGFGLIGILSVGAIVAADHPNARFVPALLRPRLLVWVGLRSYSIYLWHWPVFMVTRPGLDIALDGIPLLALRLVITLLLAELSYRFVERPIREGVLGRLWQRIKTDSSAQFRACYAVTAVIMVIVVFGLGVGVVTARPPDVPPEYVENTDSALDQQYPLDLPTATPSEATVDAPRVTVTRQSATVMPIAAAVIIPAVVTTDTQVTPTAITTPEIAVKNNQGVITDTVLLTRALGSNVRMLAIGDSVMLGARRELRGALGNVIVDAVVSRQAATTASLLRDYQAAGALGDVVILHIGTNGFMTAKQFNDILMVLVDVPHVLVFTLHVPRRWEGLNNDVIHGGVVKSPNVHVIEWHDATANSPHLFTSDGVHLQPAGRRLYVQLIVDKLKELYMPVENSGAPGAQ